MILLMVASTVGCLIGIFFTVVMYQADPRWNPPPRQETSSRQFHCFEAQVYVPTEYGTILQGDQEVCLGPMTGPSKKGRID